MQRGKVIGRRERLEELAHSAGPRPLPSERVALVTMVRDEIDVLPSFLAHHLTLVDRLYIVDHRSVDGVRKYLRRLATHDRFGAPITFYRYDDPAHNQAAMMTALMRRAFADGADWVFAVDSDEFLDVRSRGGLRDVLAAATSPLVRFDWVNLIPVLSDTAVGAAVPFDPSGAFETISGDAVPKHGKLTVHRSFVARFPGAEFLAGQHKIRPYPGAPKLLGEPLGRLLHVPARSIAQVRTKRRNLTRTGDFADVFTDSQRREYLAQLQDADELASGGSVSAEAVARLFESVVLPYEPEEVRNGSRESWDRRRIVLPPTAVPDPDLIPATGAVDGGVSPQSEEYTPARRASGLVTVELGADGVVAVRAGRSRRVRDRFLRVRAQLQMLGSVRYLAGELLSLGGRLGRALVGPTVSLRWKRQKR